MLGDGLPEGGAVYLGELKLEFAWLALPIPTSERARTPWGPCNAYMSGLAIKRTRPLTSMRLAKIAQLREPGGVPERHIDDPMVRERRERAKDGHFLATAGRARGDEHAREFSIERTFGPELPRGIPERLHVRIRSAVTNDTKGSALTFHCAGRLP